MGYQNQYNNYYGGGYNYGQAGVPGQPGVAAAQAGQDHSQQQQQQGQQQHSGGWDAAAAAAYYQGPGWGDFYSRSTFPTSAVQPKYAESLLILGQPSTTAGPGANGSAGAAAGTGAAASTSPQNGQAPAAGH